MKVIEERFKAYKEIVKIKLPQQSFIGMANDCTVNVSEEIKEYLSEIKMIDILVMSSSTTMMFDAMFFDKPVISCCFNSKSHVHTIDIRMAIDYDVLGIYRRGMPVAFSGVDLQNLLDKYLATPELYSEIRSEILRDWDYANTRYIQDFLARIEELAAR